MLTLWELVPTQRIRAWLLSRGENGTLTRRTLRTRRKERDQQQSNVAVHRAVADQTPASHALHSVSSVTSVLNSSAAARYEAMTREMLETHGIRVRRWRTSMSGIAWQVRYRDGSTARLIEAPRPKGPMSAAVFLHEVGHHAIGFNVYRPRCLEEYHAWAWAIAQMRRVGIDVTDRVSYRMHQSLAYAVGKARRRGLRQLPPELSPYSVPLPRRKSRRD